MLQRVYKISTGYWLISTLIVMALLTILCVIIGGIPGFPHFAEVIARWQKIYSARPYEAVLLAVLWMGIVGFFAYSTLKTLRILVRPRLVKGIFQCVGETSTENPRFWIEVSGSRHNVRYDSGLSSRLNNIDMSGAPVDIKIGIGDRVVSVDIV